MFLYMCIENPHKQPKRPWLPYLLFAIACVLTTIYLFFPQYYLVFLTSMFSFCGFCFCRSFSQLIFVCVNVGYCSILVVMATMSILRQRNIPKWVTKLERESETAAATNTNKSAANGSNANAQTATQAAASPKVASATAVAANVLPRRLLIVSMVLYFFGSAIWIVENALCQAKSPAQKGVNAGQVLSVLQWFQLHAWWHLFAGGGTYTWIQVSFFVLLVFVLFLFFIP